MRENFNLLDQLSMIGGNNQNQQTNQGVGGQPNWLQALDFTASQNGNSNGISGGGSNITGIGNAMTNAGLGLNIPTLQLGIGGLGALNSIFQGREATKLAKKQYNLAKDVTNTNLTNQIRSYNTALEDRARSRGVMEGRDDSYVDEYVEKNRMTR